MVVDMKELTRQAKIRMAEINSDLEKTEKLWNKNRNPEYRKAINKLRYALIVEKNRTRGLVGE